jgi:hypothetical protein
MPGGRERVLEDLCDALDDRGVKGVHQLSLIEVLVWVTDCVGAETRVEWNTERIVRGAGHSSLRLGRNECPD